MGPFNKEKTPFYVSMKSVDNVDVIKYLLFETNFDPQCIHFTGYGYKGYYPLKKWIGYRHKDAVVPFLELYGKDTQFDVMIEQFVGKLANENKLNFTHLRKDYKYRGATYLHYFAHKKNKQVCTLLIKFGADVKIQATWGTISVFELKNVVFEKEFWQNYCTLRTAEQVWPELLQIIYKIKHSIEDIGKIALTKAMIYTDCVIICKILK
jgi:hypothetical protein